MHWEYYNVPQSVIKSKSDLWSRNTLVTTLLLNRGFLDEKEVETFIYPTLKDTNNPFDFEQMSIIIDLILDKINKKEKIIVYGDYDVDGITSTAFLVKVLRNIGGDVDYYIPKRTDENYGLDKNAIDLIKRRKGKLIITVDAGYNTIDDITYSKSIGIDIIITDHHKIIKDKDDDNVLLLNPKLSESYKFKHLAGAGVALKLAQGIYQKLNLPSEEVFKYIDIVMIGTVADVVPMIEENRIIIEEGLKKLKNTEIKGLTYLIRYLRLQDKDINTTDVSYFISPLINALGRIGYSQMGAEFFLEEDEFNIYNIIEEMKKSNKIRRDLEQRIYNDAINEINKIKDKNFKSIFLSSDKWHSGVIGVVASRLSIKYNIPVTLVALKNNIGKASCRSVNGISIFDIFENMKHLLIRFGGHDLASGFIVKRDKLTEIKEIFHRSVVESDMEKEEKILKIDMEYPIENVNEELFRDLELISPFGVGNPYPLFLDRKIKLSNIRKFGIDNKHFNGMLEKNNCIYNTVAFDLGHGINDTVSQNECFDIIYYPEKVMYKGEEIIQIKIKDIRKSTN